MHDNDKKTTRPTDPEPTEQVFVSTWLADLTGGALAWQDSALCAETDPEAFFPPPGGSARDAKNICTRCEVRTECLQYALDHNEKFGVWGAMTERERRKVPRRAG